MRNEVRKQIHALHLWKHSAQSQQNKEIQIILAENSIAINTTDSIYTKLKG